MIATVFGTAGVPVTISGYAQDFGQAVTCVRFSCDEGATWTDMPIEGADPNCNVNWRFEFIPPREGIYRLLVSAVRADGTESSEPAVVNLNVAPA